LNWKNIYNNSITKNLHRISSVHQYLMTFKAYETKCAKFLGHPVSMYTGRTGAYILGGSKNWHTFCTP